LLIPPSSSSSSSSSSGNHTVALAPYFRKVVAVEIDKRLVEAARENLLTNGVSNATIIHLPSQKFTLKQLEQLRFSSGSGSGNSEERWSVVLVDPPRAGLDKKTLRLVSRFDHILYISCDPFSLLRDLESGLGGSSSSSKRRIERMAVFDHFPYCGKHIEVGVYLKKA